MMIFFFFFLRDYGAEDMVPQPTQILINSRDISNSLLDPTKMFSSLLVF